MATPTTHRNYWLHIEDKTHHESQLNNRFLYLTSSNFGLISGVVENIAKLRET
jgi:hypothetical protein